ncbi:MAG: nucleotidyltransferase family protein [Methanosarcinales archaeon]
MSSSFDINKNLEWIKLQNEKEKKLLAKKYEEVWNTLEKIKTALIREDKGIKKIILFGSVAEGNFTLNSDIDIAVECSSDKYFRLVSLVQDVSKFKVDLIDLNTVKGYIKERINTRGKIIYEK